MIAGAPSRAEFHAAVQAHAPVCNLFRNRIRRLICAVAVLALACAAAAQSADPSADTQTSASKIRHQRAHRFLAGRQSADASITPAIARQSALDQHLALVNANALLPHSSPLVSSWQSVGPTQVQSISYGAITGRISSLAIDTSDSTGNTLYVGATGGGIWKSTNANSSSPDFAPLTDNLSVYIPATGSSTVASLSIGAITVQPGGTGVVLAGTGDPNDALDSYYGQGILRSANGGQTWSLIQSSHDGTAGTHSFIGNGFAGFAWSSTNTSLAVAAVSQAAEGVIVNAPVNVYSIQGLFYSTDAGQTWQMATIMDGSQTVQSASTNFSSYFGNPVTAVVWNPIRQRFYAAVRYHGYYYSTNGQTWYRLANQPGANLTTTNCPANPGLSGSLTCPIFRGALAVDPVTGDTFAFTVDAGNLDQGIFRDVCNLTSGSCSSSTETFAAQLNSTPLEAGSGSTAITQGDYNFYLSAVHSNADTILFAGTQDIYRCSIAAGCAFRNTTNAYSCAAAQVAPAQHAVDVLSTGGPLLYFGNDGGLWRTNDGINQQQAVCSTDDANHFTNLNSGLGSLGEVVSLAAHPSDATQMLAGLGANGSAASNGSSGVWTQLSSGEGGTAAIDATTPTNYFLSTNEGVSINLCTQGESCLPSQYQTAPIIGATQVSSDQSLIDPPWILDPELTSQLILGTCRIWRGPATGGNSWSAADLISPMFDGVSNSFCNGNALVRSLAAGGALASGAGSQVIYAGMAGLLDGGGSKSGHIFTTTAASTAGPGTAWTDLYAPTVTNDTANSGKFNPGNFDISSIAVDPHDTTGKTVYATVMGFSGNAYSVPHIYMSTTGGTSWTNISSNLPNAPANAVLVDPNSASTVYVATDTGIYVTQAVTTCASTNCWSVFGTGLPNAPVTQLAAIAQGGTSVLAVGTYGRGVWQLPLASTLAATTISLNSTSLNFASQLQNSTSTAQTITVTNTGTTLLQVTSLSISGNFAQTNNCTSGYIAAGSSCTISVTFTPASAGTLSGTLTINGNISGGSASVSLSGQGTAPSAAAITFNPTSLTFAAINVGSTSTSQQISLTNSGTASLQIGNISLQGDFAQNSNCIGTIAVGSSCTITVTFSPLSTGPLVGTITVSANITGGSATVSLAGTGTAIGTLTPSPATYSFGTVTYESTSPAGSITLQNTGTAPLTISTVAVSTYFAETDNCAGVTLAVNATCSISATFTPTTFGNLYGSLTVTSNASNASLSIPLSGYSIGFTNVSITVSPNSVTFPIQAVGTTSAAQNVTVSLTTSSNFYTSTITTTGDFSQSNSCTTTSVYFGHPCTIAVTFTPSVTGTRTGTLVIAGNLTTGPVSIPLTGTGSAGAYISIAPSSLTFSGQQTGTTSTAQALTVSNSGAFSATLNTPVLTGDYAIVSTGTTCGTTLAAGASCYINIAFTPTATGTRTGSISIANSGTGGTATASFTGTGLAPASIALTTSALNFASTDINSTTASQNITITNSGGEPGTLTTPQVSGDFAVASKTCTTSLPANTSCIVAITFTPTASGARTGTFQIGSSSGTLSASLSGIGLTPATDTLSPPSLTFAGQQQGTTSATQSVSLTNSGDDPLNTITAQITGDFAISANSCPATLAGHSGCAISIAYTPKVTGAETGSLTIADSIHSQSVSLSGTGLAAPFVTIAPTSLTFANQQTNTTSTAQPLTVSNSGAVQATLSTPVLTGDYAISSSNCGSTLAANTSCTLYITFTPATTGTRAGAISIPNNGTSGTVTATFTGTGVSPSSISITTPALNFAGTSIGTTTAAQNIVITNTGGEPGTLTAPTLSGDFAITADTCSTTLAANTSCAVSITFTPTASGTRSGIFQIGSSSGTLSAALSGIGLSIATDTLSPSSLAFAGQQQGTISAAQTVTLTNSGDDPLTNITAQISGDFILSASTCAATLAGHSSCFLSVAYSPKSIGAETGTLIITDAIRSQSIALTGTGLTPPGVSLSPAPSLNFGTIGVGQSTAAQLVTLSNNGGTPLAIAGISIAGAGDFSIPTGGNNCPAQLAAGASCTLQLIFTPLAAGARSATLTFNDNASSTPQTLALSGTGLDFALSIGTTTFTVASGQQAVYTIAVSPAVTGLTSSIAFACTGVPTDATCAVTTSPASPTLATATTVTITVSTGVNPAGTTNSTSAQLRHNRITLALLPALLPMFWITIRMRRYRRYFNVAILLVALIFSAAGCGSGTRTIPESTSSGNSATYTTPSGTYTLTLTATSAGVTHSQPLTLIVQ